MGLTLATLRCPDAATPEGRHAAGGEFTIGRGPDNDWVLADPDRHLSKRHCVLAFRSGQVAIDRPQLQRNVPQPGRQAARLRQHAPGARRRPPSAW